MKISIITATFNSGATLRDTMESVLSQSYQDIEHIIVDGNSKDNTMAIVHEMESKYDGRLRYISEPDRGIYDAMNKGIDMATGDVVGILNSDDFYSSDRVVEFIASVFSNYDLDAVYGDIHFVNDDNLKKCVRYYSSSFFKPWMMRIGMQPAHPSFYCKRSVYEKYGKFDIDFKIAADFENLLRLIYIHRIKVSYLPLDFVTMRTGGASTSGINSHRRILSDHLRAYRKNGVNSNLFLDVSRYAYKMGELLFSKIHTPHDHSQEFIKDYLSKLDISS
ncbi:MAG: glycosyltransferase [Muribaculum sp.]|nr:glycosyltransferase [Muribaculum sp.]